MTNYIKILLAAALGVAIASPVLAHCGSPHAKTSRAAVAPKKPAIAEGIAEYEAQFLNFPDIRAEKMNVLQNLKALALSPGVRDKVRLEASIALYKFCEEAERAAAARLSDCS